MLRLRPRSLALLLLHALVGITTITLPAAAEEPSAPPATPVAVQRVDARNLPHCPVPSRVIAIVSTSDRDSLAVLSVAGADEGTWQKLVRVGDRFAGSKVGHIGHQRVWLRGSSGWCQLTRSLPSEAPATAAVAPPPPPPRRGAAAKASLPAEIASSIRQVGENEVHVDRSVVDGIIAQQGTLLKGVQIVPRTENGKTVAVGLRGVRDGTLLHSLGLRSGDELQSVNGFNVADPESALQAYAKLRTAERLTIAVVRDGKPMSIDVAVK